MNIIQDIHIPPETSTHLVLAFDMALKDPPSAEAKKAKAAAKARSDRALV